MILIDTNVLVRMTRSHDPQSRVVRAAVQSLRSQGERLTIVPQNLFEFWVVATRPAERNGLGMSVTQAGHWLRFLRRQFILLPDREKLDTIWQDLVEKHAVTSFRAHDIRLVAAMQTYGITQLLTFNGADFRGFTAVLDPAAV